MSKKVKLYIDQNEIYPVHSLSEESNWRGQDFVILSEEDLTEYRDIASKYWAWQSRIENMDTECDPTPPMPAEAYSVVSHGEK